MCVAIQPSRRVFFTLMRTNLNLSRRPFTNRRLFWIGVLSILLVSGLFFVWISGQKVEAEAKTRDLQQQIDDRERSINELKKKLDTKKVDVKLTELTSEQTFQLA